LAAELETALNEDSRLIESTGGVFEVENNGRLIFSKKAVGRFPDPGEVLAIVEGLAAGFELSDAQGKAAASIASPPGFQDWLSSAWKRLAGK
jgi:selenoprotein W-related protein